MKRISRLFNSLPKRLVGLAAIVLAIVLPVSSMAADSIRMEGSLGVANVTAGDTTYKQQVNASYDQVVKLQVYYHNQENPDSGKIANNVKVKITMPTAPGTNQVVRSTTNADNANTVNSQATVTLNRADAYLEYIPGSAVWKHNTGSNEAPSFVETKISDNVVYGGQGLVLENAKPCFNFAATVTVLARVRVPGVQIVKTVRVKGTTTWSQTNTAKPGDTLQYQLAYKNTGNSTQNAVVLRDNLPPKMTYVAGTTQLKNDSGIKAVADGVTLGGLAVGNYGPGAAAYILFEVKVPAADQLACGVTEFRNVGVVRPQGMNEFYNTAVTTVTKECAEVPAYSCDLLDVTKGANREVTISDFKFTAVRGATFKQVVINWGDNTTPLTTNNAKGQKHTYAADGTYTISAVAHFTVNGQDVTAAGAACSKQVSYSTTAPPTAPVTPGKLVETGPGDVLGIFAAVTAAGALAHRFVLSRRFL